MRIVSLLPSATDIVVGLGADAELVGVSHSCGASWNHLPALTRTWVDSSASSASINAEVVNATKPLYELDISLLEQLAPDVVISQSLCDVCAVPFGDVEVAVREVSSRPRLVDLAPSRLDDLPTCFQLVGDCIGREREAGSLIVQWQDTLESYRGRFAGTKFRIAFLDWLDPPFAAGHWVPDMIEWLGALSVLATPGEPSFEVSWEKVYESRPDLVIAACCGFTAERTRQESVKRDIPMEILDGYELFSRPSPSLMESLALLADTIDKRLVTHD